MVAPLVPVMRMALPELDLKGAPELVEEGCNRGSVGLPNHDLILPARHCQVSRSSSEPVLGIVVSQLESGGVHPK